jgi:hypothetical protein
MLEQTGGSLMHQSGCDPGLGVHCITFCIIHIRYPSFIYVIVQMGNLTGCPKCTGIKDIMTIYACGSVTIYPVQSVLSYTVLSHAKLTFMKVHRSLAKQDLIFHNFLVTEYVSHGLLRALNRSQSEFIPYS